MRIMTKVIKLLSICLLFIMLGFSSCNTRERREDTAKEQVLDYPVITLSPSKASLQNVYPASIEGQQNIEIRPKVDGYIETIYIDEGAVVKKGDPLFTISAPQYEQEVRTAQADIKIAETNVNSAQMEVNKVRPLVEKNIVSKYELEEAEFKLQSQKAILAQAEATLINAKTNIGYTHISSPVSGMVGNLPYRVGSLVTANTPLPLTTVSDISNVFAYFSMNEKQLLEMTSNLEDDVQSLLSQIPAVELILSNNRRFSEKGRVEATSGSINTSTGSVRVRATFPNPHSHIRNGSSGSVVIPLTVDSAIIVPQKATYEIQGSRFVYLINEENKAISTPISVMDNSDGQFFVVTEGLETGDQIALEGLPSLRDGMTVKRRPVNIDSVFNSLGVSHDTLK